MGLPIRTHVVYFQQSPSIKNLKTLLSNLTGLVLSFEDIEATEQTPNGLGILNKKWPNHSITIDWFSSQGGINMRIWSETSKSSYLEVSMLYLLEQLGGKIEKFSPLPSWAGKEWKDVQPRSPLAKIKFWLNGTLPA